jgi:membrane protease YdiL (CAAX protease family)
VSALGRWLERGLWQPLRALEAERSPRGGALDPRVPVVLVTVAVSLSLQLYWGERSSFVARFPPGQPESAWTGDYYELWQLTWWVGWRVAGYVALPWVAIAVMPGERIRDYFLGLGDLRRHALIYLGLYLLVLPLVVVASRGEEFRLAYPFYKWANRSALDFWLWQALYATQFVALEFFFRGFMLAGLRRSFGAGAIFVMIVPYCMVHFGKPLPETLGAIVAGVVLGALAMRSRSIWGGVWVHLAVAVTMDVLAAAHCPPSGSGLPCPSFPAGTLVPW